MYQAREFDELGNPVRDIDFTGPTFPNGTLRPNHSIPDQHPWLNVQAHVHAFDDFLPSESVGRFTTPKGGAPTSWGEAATNRIGAQNASLPKPVAHGVALHWMGRFLMADLLTVTDLPAGFDYPAEFIRVVELGLTQLEPWWIIEGELLRDRHRGLKSRYPSRSLVPFAVRQDRDDVACFEGGSKRVAVIHDFADPGWENRAEFDDFNGWLRQAVEDLIDFGGG